MVRFLTGAGTCRSARSSVRLRPIELPTFDRMEPGLAPDPDTTTHAILDCRSIFLRHTASVRHHSDGVNDFTSTDNSVTYGIKSSRAAGRRADPSRMADTLTGMKATMLLADYAQVSEGKLNVIGGGW